MKRTIDDRDGNPVEIEVDDALPARWQYPDDCMTLDEVIQTFQIARAIIKGDIKPPPIMPGHENRYKRKKGKHGR